MNQSKKKYFKRIFKINFIPEFVSCGHVDALDKNLSSRGCFLRRNFAQKFDDAGHLCRSGKLPESEEERS